MEKYPEWKRKLAEKEREKWQHPRGTLALSSRERTKISCPMKKQGCSGKLELAIKYVDGSRVEPDEFTKQSQFVCSVCGVIFLAVHPKDIKVHKTFIERWLVNHHTLVEAAEQRKWYHRLSKVLSHVVLGSWAD